MTKSATAFGVLTEPTTLTIERLLPGPIERIWDYLTDSDLRRQWLAAGRMEGTIGSPVELVWRNDDLSDPPSRRPAGFPEEQRMTCLIKEFDPPHRLVISWSGGGDVSFDLAPKGSKVLLTLTHRRMADRSAVLMFGAGWHMHLDILVARANGRAADPFWEGWSRLKADYERRIPT